MLIDTNKAEVANMKNQVAVLKLFEKLKKVILKMFEKYDVNI